MAIDAVAGGLYAEPENVLIAVNPDLSDGLLVAAGFALLPELLPRSAPVMGNPRIQGLVESFPVHPGEHDDLMRADIGDDSGYQSVGIKTRTEFSRCFEIMRMADGSQGRPCRLC